MDARRASNEAQPREATGRFRHMATHRRCLREVAVNPAHKVAGAVPIGMAAWRVRIGWLHHQDVTVSARGRHYGAYHARGRSSSASQPLLPVEWSSLILGGGLRAPPSAQ